MSPHLTLVLTRRCNLRCGWCPQDFKDEDMGTRTLRNALLGAAGRLGRPLRLKLFGGEPLLAPERLMEAVELCSRLGRPRVELATNGTLLQAPLLDFLKRHPEVEVFLSRPSPQAVSLPNVSFSLLIAPGDSPKAALARLAEALALGVRRFNVLPAYYVPWSEDRLEGLQEALGGIAEVMRRLRGSRRPPRVLNGGRRGPIPLYNGGWTVDTDGQVYAGNLFLARGAERLKGRLRLGRANRWSSLKPLPPARVLRAALRLCYSPEILEASRRVDSLLGEFVGRVGAL